MLDDAVAESIEEEIPPSSIGVRESIQEAMKEVTEKTREEQGKFTAPETPDPVNPDPVDKTLDKPVDKLNKAPDAWSPQAKSKFAKLDPDIQAEVMRREVEIHKGFTKQDETRNVGKHFNDAIAPYLPMIRAEGGDPIAAVQALMQTAYNLRQSTPDQKEHLLIQLAQQYGINMQGVFNRLSGQQQQRVDPQVAHMQQQLSQLQQERTNFAQANEANEQAQINSTIDGFASNPKNVYFTNVKPEMAALLREGRAKDLQEAYEMACWARSDIRPLMLQQQDQQKTQAMRDKSQRARMAGVSISGSPTGSAGVIPSGERSLSDELRANLREVMGRN